VKGRKSNRKENRIRKGKRKEREDTTEKERKLSN
jgi:hypothetical protein